jgi:hypothetical protein
MPRHLTGRDMTVATVETGGVVDGTPTWVTPVSIRCYLDSYEREESQNSIDVTARCDSEAQAVPSFATLRVTLVLTSPAAGFLVPDSWRGQYIRVIATMIASGDTFTDIGMVESIRISSPKDGVITQTVTIGPAYVDA